MKDMNLKNYVFEESPFEPVTLEQLAEQEYKMPRLDQLPWFQINLNDMPQQTYELLFGTSTDHAKFLVKHALKYNYSFQTRLLDLFKDTNFQVVGNMKADEARISQKIIEN